MCKPCSYISYLFSLDKVIRKTGIEVGHIIILALIIHFGLKKHENCKFHKNVAYE